MKFISPLILILALNFGFAQTYTIKNLELNDDKSQYGVVFYKGDKVYYTSYMLDDRNRARLDNDKRLIFTMFEGEMTDDGEIINPKQFNKSEKFVFNTSSAGFSKDGKYMYITTNFMKRGKSYKRKQKSINLNIQRGEYKEGVGWTNFEPLPFCKPSYNYGHATLGPDGSTLYFTSNADGAHGQTDIFKVKILGNDEYGEVVNLGKKINSPRKDMFPFISNENVLYFSSDRAGGVGGLDVYSYDLNGDPDTTEPKLLPEPINSRSDDFCYIVNEDGTKGYFSSRRPKGKGDDDIYFFTLE
ncbi:TolB family protein [Psychroserpens sp. Hel_I_66]|uniref:TolB family protein n=1 Tax=Psychroserpens sp. Hel_I_66 TaxID=1250004 RepID=UPI0009DD7535|nr:PD40 domain-containing protein [Psychroserpens sp. Hel_I_66]